MGFGLMEYTIRNRIIYDPVVSQSIGEAAGQQRQAYNYAVDSVLENSELTKYDLYYRLTELRQLIKWSGNLRVQRTGLTRGRDSTKAWLFSDEDKRIPKESLHRSRKDELVLIVQDQVKLLDPTHIRAGGIVMELRYPIDPTLDVRAVQILERKSSQKRSRNHRSLSDYSYDIHIVHRLPDPEPKAPETVIGLDAGIAHILTDSEGNFHDYNQDRLPELHESKKLLIRKLTRLKPSGRMAKKIRKAVRRINYKISNIKDDFEHKTAKALSESSDVIAIENLNHRAMKAKGGAYKRGLNRELSNSRPASMQSKLQRHCDKQGTWLVKVSPWATSTTCNRCNFRYKHNRKSQSGFLCRACGYEANADVNAALNVRSRGVDAMRLLLTPKASRAEKARGFIISPGAGIALVRRQLEEELSFRRLMPSELEYA